MTQTLKEYEERASLIASFRAAVDLYKKLLTINSVYFYYNGYNSTSHSVADDHAIAIVAKDAVLEHQRNVVKMKYDDLCSKGIDATAEMPMALMPVALL
jgi:hypothetical protein